MGLWSQIPLCAALLLKESAQGSKQEPIQSVKH